MVLSTSVTAFLILLTFTGSIGKRNGFGLVGASSDQFGKPPGIALQSGEYGAQRYSASSASSSLRGSPSNGGVVADIGRLGATQGSALDVSTSASMFGWLLSACYSSVTLTLPDLDHFLVRQSDDQLSFRRERSERVKGGEWVRIPRVLSFLSLLFLFFLAKFRSSLSLVPSLLYLSLSLSASLFL